MQLSAVGRARLRRAIASRSAADAAIVPLIEAHAARLEQLAEDRWPADAEAQARMLRAAQALYDVDAVTVGGGGLVAAAASWLAQAPALTPGEAVARARASRPLSGTPLPASVADTRIVDIARDVIGRLRAVLAERAGITVVLPDPSRLAAQLGKPEDVGWAGEVLSEILRALGPAEPDLVFLSGDDDRLDPALESLAEFFGATLVPLGRDAPKGVVILAATEALRIEGERGWLYTTREEIPPETDPSRLRAAIARLRGKW